MAVQVDEEYISRLQGAYARRSERPALVQYTDRGDLQVFRKGGKGKEPILEETIRINEYRPVTNEERERQEALRYEQIREAEIGFEQKRREYRDLLRAYRQQIEAGGPAEGEDAITEDDVVNMSKEATALDLALQVARFAERAARKYESVVTNQMLFDDPKNEKVLKNVAAFIASPFDTASTYVRLARAGEVTRTGEAAVKKERVRKEKTVAVIVAGGPGTPYEFLNPWSPASVTYEGAVYPNAYMALMAGMAEKFGDSVALERIRAATTPEGATYTRDEKDIAEEEWNAAFGRVLMKVTQNKFAKNPLLAQQLMQTGTARLVIVPLGDPLNTLLGTGLQPDNPDIKNPKKWVGENLYGVALELMRSKLIKKQEEAAAAGAAALGAGAGAGPGAGAGVAGAAAAAAGAAGAAVSVVTDAAADAISAVGSALPAAAEAAAAAATSAIQTAASFVPGQTVVAKKKTLKKSAVAAAPVAGAGAGAGAGATTE